MTIKVLVFWEASVCTVVRRHVYGEARLAQLPVKCVMLSVSLSSLQ